MQNQPTSPVPHIYLARALRDFCDGFVAILLPVYLTKIGLGPFEVGVVATLALFGSALTTLAFGALAAHIDHRKLLLAASAIMVASGLAFAFSTTYAVVLLIAFVGTVNPSAGSSSIFSSLEQAVLSRSVADRARTKIFARYSLIGAFAAAIGALASGIPELLTATGISQITALRGMFVVYALLGLTGGAMYARMPAQPSTTTEKPASALGPSKTIVLKMAALFSIDSFGSGFAVQSLVALWLFTKFNLSLAEAGFFFF